MGGETGETGQMARYNEKTESGKLGAAGIPAAETGIKSVPLMQTTADSVEQQGCGATRVQ